MPALAALRSRHAVVHAGQRRARGAAGDRQERRHEVLARLHLGRSRAIASRSRRDRFLLASCSKMFLEGGRADALRRQEADAGRPRSIRCSGFTNPPTRAATTSRSSSCSITWAATTTRHRLGVRSDVLDATDRARAWGSTIRSRKLDVARVHVREAARLHAGHEQQVLQLRLPAGRRCRREGDGHGRTSTT